MAFSRPSIPTIPWPWQVPLVVALIGIAVIALLYWPTLVSIEAIWRRSGNFTHGYLILPIVGYMVWLLRPQLVKGFVRPSALGWPVAFGGAVLWVAARLTDVLFAEQFAVTFMFQGLLISIFGWRIAWIAIFPLLYLLFAVPFGQGLEPHLQDFTAWVSVGLLQLQGMPVLREGLFFTIPSGSFEVAEACSGMRYLVASMALGCLFAFMNFKSVWRKAAFIAFSLVLPILANGVRAYLIVIMAHYSNHKLAVGVDHLIYGWVFFGLVMLLLFWVGSKFRDEGPQLAEPGEKVLQSLSPPTEGHGKTSGFIVYAVVAVLLAASALPFSSWLISRPANAEQYSLKLPAALTLRDAPTAVLESWNAQFAEADLHARGAWLTSDAVAVQYDISYYIRQAQGRELVSGTNTVFDSEQWRRLGERYRQIETASGPLQIHETIVRHNSGQSLLVWDWYWVNGVETTNGVKAKLFEAAARLKRSDNGSAAVVLAIPFVGTDSGPATNVLGRFVSSQLVEIRKLLSNASPGNVSPRNVSPGDATLGNAALENLQNEVVSKPLD